MSRQSRRNRKVLRGSAFEPTPPERIGPVAEQMPPNHWWLRLGSYERKCVRCGAREMSTYDDEAKRMTKHFINPAGEIVDYNPPCPKENPDE